MTTVKFEGSTEQVMQQVAELAASAHNRVSDLELRLSAHHVAIGCLRGALEAGELLTVATWQEALRTAARRVSGLAHSLAEGDATTTRKFSEYIEELASAEGGKSRFEVIDGGSKETDE